MKNEKISNIINLYVQDVINILIIMDTMMQSAIVPT